MIRTLLCTVLICGYGSVRIAHADPGSFVDWNVRDICLGRVELRNIDGVVRVSKDEIAGVATGHQLEMQVRSADLTIYAVNERLDHEANGACNARRARRLVSAHIANGSLHGQKISSGGDLRRIIIDEGTLPLTRNDGTLVLFGGAVKAVSGILRVHDRVSIASDSIVGSFDLVTDHATVSGALYGYRTETRPSVVPVNLVNESNTVQLNIRGFDGSVALTSGTLSAANVKHPAGTFEYQGLALSFASGVEQRIVIRGAPDNDVVESSDVRLRDVTAAYGRNVDASFKSPKVTISSISGRLPHRESSIVLASPAIASAAASTDSLTVRNTSRAIALQGPADLAFSVSTAGLVSGRVTLRNPALPLLPGQTGEGLKRIELRDFRIDQTGATFEAQVHLAELFLGRVSLSDVTSVLNVHYHGGDTAAVSWHTAAAAVAVYQEVARTTKQYIADKAKLSLDATLNFAATWSIDISAQKLDVQVARMDSLVATMLGGSVVFGTPGTSAVGVRMHNVTPVHVGTDAAGDLELGVQSFHIKDAILTLSPNADPMRISSLDSTGAVTLRVGIAGLEHLESGVLEANRLQAGKVIWKDAHFKMQLDSFSVDLIRLSAKAGVADVELQGVRAPSGELSRDAAPRLEVVLESPGLRVEAGHGTIAVGDGPLELTDVSLAGVSCSARTATYTDETGLQMTGFHGTLEFPRASRAEVEARLKLTAGTAQFQVATASGRGSVDQLNLAVAGTLPKLHGTGRIEFADMAFRGEVGVHTLQDRCGENLLWLALNVDTTRASGDLTIEDGKLAIGLSLPRTQAKFELSRNYQCEWNEQRSWEAKKLYFYHPCPTLTKPWRQCKGWTYITPEIHFSIRWILRIFSAGGQGWLSDVNIHSGGEKGFKLCGGHMREFAPTKVTLFHLNWTLPNSNLITGAIREFVNGLATALESTLANSGLSIAALLSQFGVGEHMNILGSCYQ